MLVVVLLRLLVLRRRRLRRRVQMRHGYDDDDSYYYENRYSSSTLALDSPHHHNGNMPSGYTPKFAPRAASYTDSPAGTRSSSPYPGASPYVSSTNKFSKSQLISYSGVRIHLVGHSFPNITLQLFSPKTGSRRARLQSFTTETTASSCLAGGERYIT